MRADRVGGLIAVLLGLGAIAEAVRLYPIRLSPWVGDHVMPLLVGVLLVLLGLLLAVRGEGGTFDVSFPQGRELRALLGTFALLVGYWLAVPWLGYLLTTWIVSALLFGLLGPMRWFTAVLSGTVLTAVVYAVFLLGLTMSFPGGWLEGLLGL